MIDDHVGKAQNHSFVQLYLAGVGTTSSILYYLISVLATHPAIQEEAHEHVVDVIGVRKPSLKDRFTIPYVESMILEILRLMSHVPVAIPHMTRTDTTLQGYEIPKGTQVNEMKWNGSKFNQRL